jgi:hypothetical protein
VAIVARHGLAVVPLLMGLLSDDASAEQDRKRWKVQQQVALTLCRIYSESTHCGRTYCDGNPPERIANVKAGWLRVIASEQEMRALSTAELLDRFKTEDVFWRQFEIGQALAAANDPTVIPALEAGLTQDDRHLRGNGLSCSLDSATPGDSRPLSRSWPIALRDPAARAFRVAGGACRRRFAAIATMRHTCLAI